MLMLRMPARWYIAGLLCLVTIINYVDRQALSVLAPVLMEEFSISHIQYGWITSGFLLTYAVGQLLSGVFIDRYGSKISLSVAVGLWSVAGIAHSFAGGFIGLLIARLFLGLTESANYPAGIKVISEWFPARDRGMAVAILNLGPGIGAAVAPPILGYIAFMYSWQWAFVVAGAIGFAWIVIWQLVYQPPERYRWLSSSEKSLILSERQVAGPDLHSAGQDSASIKELLKSRKVLGLMVSRFTCEGAYYFLVFWIPAYLAQERGMNILEIGMMAWIPFVATDIGALAAGYASTKMMRQGMSLNKTRVVNIWIGALLVPFGILAAYIDSEVIAILMIGIAMFGIMYKSVGIAALPADLFPSDKVARVFGLSAAAGGIGAMMFQPLAGWLIDNFSYEPVFLMVGTMHLIGAACINQFVTPIGVDEQVDVLATK